MRTVYVKFSTQRDVEDFVERLSGLKGNFDLIDGHFILDARSMMGIFSLDLSKPIRLDISLDTPESRRAVAPFIAELPGAEGEA